MSNTKAQCPEHLSIKEIEDLYPTKRCNSCENNVYQAGMCTCQLLIDNVEGGGEMYGI